MCSTAVASHTCRSARRKMIPWQGGAGARERGRRLPRGGASSSTRPRRPRIRCACARAPRRAPTRCAPERKGQRARSPQTCRPARLPCARTLSLEQTADRVCFVASLAGLDQLESAPGGGEVELHGAAPMAPGSGLWRAAAARSPATDACAGLPSPPQVPPGDFLHTRGACSSAADARWPGAP